MRTCEPGTITLFVLLVSAALAILASVMMHQAHYMQRSATDTLAYQQRMSAVESVLRYAAVWCALNKDMLDQVGDDGTQEPWRLELDGVPLAFRRGVAASAEIASDGQGGWNLTAELGETSKSLARASCVLASVSGQTGGSLVRREWQVTG